MAVKTVSDNSGALDRAVRELLHTRLLVGIPAENAERKSASGEKGTPPNNALVGYIQEFGEPLKNIPARPFLVPGCENAKPVIVDALLKAGLDVLEGKPEAVERGFQKAGLAAVAAVKAKMIEGPFAPLSDRTIEERARRRYSDTGRLVGGKSNRDARNFLKLRGQGTPDDVLHEAGLATPLLDTRSLFDSITYVVRNKDHG